MAPVAGEIYTIREIGMLHPIEKDVVCVLLEELVNDPLTVKLTSQDWEPPFGAWRFRPLQVKKTSIEIFEKMLAPNPKILENVE